MRFHILILLTLVTALSSRAFGEAKNFCDRLASGDAAMFFQNPVDPSTGQAWPLQGKALDQPVTFEIEGKSYVAFRLLGQGAEGKAYLGFDVDLNLIVIKDTDMDAVNALNEIAEKPKQSPQDYLRELILKAKFLNDNGIRAVPVIASRFQNNRAILVKTYVPGIIVSELGLETPLGASANQSVDQAMDKMMELMISEKYFDLIDRNRISGGMDPSSGNWIYFNQKIYLIDF